ncbi:MAG: hypothetical protein ACC682_08820, partial [Gemmatimonadota bacterium]
PGRFAGDGIVIGLEYALLDNPRLVAGMADAFAETGLPGMKHYVEAVSWGEMQSGPDEDIDFETFDLFVREYQIRGFTELTIALKPHSRWASKDVRLLTSTNASPKPEYEDLFQDWVEAVVERYDGDGVDDMEGLRWPIRYVEIGNEFSSYQPEPVQEYLNTLQLAYEAAHRANDDVLVGHAAFLFAPVDMDVSDPSEYETVWAETRRVDRHHGLADMRVILDNPDTFDFINIHNLGEPYEIEHVMRWIEYETELRGYEKPVVISDTTPTSYIGWGPANRCTGQPLGLLGSPATEEDRCRLAAFFTRLLDGDRETLDWTRGFVAADHVQRTIIAAEQGVRLINLAFVTDILWLTLKPMNAGAGIAAWGGAIRINPWTGRVLEYFPAFYAIQQMMGHLTGYRSIVRVEHADERVRLYRIEKDDDRRVWIAWMNPMRALLPEDGTPSIDVELEIDGPVVTLESVITAMSQTAPRRSTARTSDGVLSATLTPTPVYITPRSR